MSHSYSEFGADLNNMGGDLEDLELLQDGSLGSFINEDQNIGDHISNTDDPMFDELLPAQADSILNLNELIDWYQSSAFKERLIKYVNNNRIVYEDTGEDIETNIDINNLTAKNNQFYLSNRKIVNHRYYLQTGIYVFANSGKPVELTRKEITNLPGTKLKKIYNQQQIVPEYLYKQYNSLVFADTGKALTEAEKEEVKNQGKMMLNNCKVITKLAWSQNQKLVFAGPGPRFLTDEEKKRVVTDEKGKKSLDNQEVITKNAWRNREYTEKNKTNKLNSWVFEDGIPLNDAETKQIFKGKGKKSYQGKKVITFKTYLSYNHFKFAEGPKNGNELTKAEQRRIQAGFCDGFAVIAIPKKTAPCKRKKAPANEAPPHLKRPNRNKESILSAYSCLEINSLFTSQGADNKSDGTQHRANTSSTTEEERLRNVYAGFSSGGSGFFTPPPTPHTLPVNDDPLVEIFSDYDPF